MLKRERPDEGGTIIVLTAMLLVVFLGLAALAVDAGIVWSNRRVAQGIADTSVMAALQAVPKTMSGAAAATQAQQAAQDLAATNNASNDSSVVVTSVDVVPQPGQVDVEIEVEFSTGAAFGPVVGGPDTYDIGAAAEGRIDIYLPGQTNADGNPTMRLLPLGAPAGTSARMLCRAESPAACPAGASSALDVIGMRRVDTQCHDADETTVGNLASGVDHLIAFDSDLRDEREACEVRYAGGHAVSLPNTSRLIPSGRVPYSPAFTQVLGGPPLWTYLRDDLTGACDKVAIAALPDIDAQTNQMRMCLQTGDRPLFNTSMSIGDRRLGWGVFTQLGGTEVRYTGSTVFWVHSVIDATGQTTNPAGGGYSGAVVFRLDPDMLPGGFAPYVPLSAEGLEFTLTD